MWKRVSEHFDVLCSRFICRKHVDRCGSVVLSQAADASRCPIKTRDEWCTDLLPVDYLDVDYVDGEVSHERLTLWPLLDRNAPWLGRSPENDEWPEDLSCVVPNFGPLRAWPFCTDRVATTREKKTLCIPSTTRVRAPARCELPGKRASDSKGW